MFDIDLPLYLASKSPRRRKLLSLMNLPFESFEVDLQEKIKDGEHPVRTVKRLALEKMDEAKKSVGSGIIITADTIVVIDNKILGKPKDEKDAVRILSRLSDNEHTVYTGVAVYNSGKDKTIVDYEKTKVIFRKLEKDEIKEYVAGGSPMDKAGAYGIQDDYGAFFVKKISGCYYNVVGLPLSKLHSMMKKVL